MNENDFDHNHRERDPWFYHEDPESGDSREQGGSENPQKEPSGNPPPQDGADQQAQTPPPQDGADQQAQTPPPQDGADQQAQTPPPQDGADQQAQTPPPQNDAGQQPKQNWGPQPPYPPYGYGQYGQYGGQYGQQYGQYGGYPPYGGNPYGQENGAYGQQPAEDRERHDNPYGQPYWNYPYGGQYGQPPQGPTPPKKMNKGLKAFLWILGILVAGLIIGTGIYGIQAAYGQRNGAGTSSSASSAQEQSGASSSASSGQVIGGVQGNGNNPNSPGITIAAHPSGAAMSASEVYKNVIQSVVGVKTTVKSSTSGESGTSEGTGIIATSDGYILTNAHVVNYSRTDSVQVVLHNNKTYEAKVVGYDKTSDLAVLKINATGLSPATFGSLDGTEVGDQVIAIGNPGGLSFAGSLTGGYVSALDRTIEDHSDNGMTYIQTDAAINPGNSGGPLVNLYGQVIGINSNKIIATGYEGMGFAIPVSRAKTVIDDLIANGYVSGRTRLGITASSVPDMYAQTYGFPQGVLIQAVGSDSDLKSKGVVQGDIVTKADGTTITGMDDLYAVLNRHKPGDTIKMTIYSTSLSETAGGGKAGTSREISVKLLEDKGQTQ